MAVQAPTSHEKEHAEGVYHQFESIEQQNESYIVGMWTFLVTEVMFFGPLFFIYILYRWQYQAEFYLVHKELDWVLGGINTTILLISSLTIALAVHFSQVHNRKKELLMLGATVSCAFAFLVIKGFEWGKKFSYGVVPGVNFQWGGDHLEPEVAAVPPRIAEMFFSIYYAMTGLHAIHVVIGIIAIGTLMLLIARKSELVESFIPTEMVALYWHFVDLVWIFLFPLFYLMPK